MIGQALTEYLQSSENSSGLRFLEIWTAHACPQVGPCSQEPDRIWHCDKSLHPLQFRRNYAETHILLSIDVEAHPRTLEYLDWRKPHALPPPYRRAGHCQIQQRCLMRPFQYNSYLATTMTSLFRIHKTLQYTKRLCILQTIVCKWPSHEYLVKWQQKIELHRIHATETVKNN
jgi:hypothetical protein